MRESVHEDLADLYEVLEVSPRASHDVIQAAFRVLARNSHPDRNSASDAEQRFRQINAAYQVLSDPGQRAKYDLECTRARRTERLLRSGMEATSLPRARRERDRARVLVMRSPIEPRGEERFSAFSLPVFLLVSALVAVGAFLVLVVWLSTDSALGDDAVSINAVPIRTHPIVQFQPFELPAGGR